MAWWRQCCALMNKNRLIKCRMCGSTIAEILLPVLVMLIMVGLREAVTKDEFPARLHVGPYVPADAPAPIVDRSRYLVMKNVLFDTRDPEAGTPWDGSAVASWIQRPPTPDHDVDRGTRGVQTIQFVGGTAAVECMEDFKLAYPVLASQVQNRFANDDDLDDYVTGSSYATSSANAAVYIAVVFRSSPSAGATNRVWDYAIRGNSTFDILKSSALLTSESLVDTLQTKYEPEPYVALVANGHLLMQDFVERWIIERETGKTLDRSYSYQPFPTPPYIDDPFADSISDILGIFFTIIYIWPVTRLVKGIVEEKQLRIKEGMRMMGLPDSALFCSWLGTYTLMFLLTSIGITIVTSATVYEHSNKVYVFFFFFLFAMSTFSFCWLLSVFFSRAQVATTFAALFFLAFFFPYFAVQGSGTSTGAKGVACLASQICFGLGAVVMAKLESRSGGISSDNVNTLVDGWSYNATIGMFIADFFIYLILALYFQQIVPSEWGTHRKWYFCVQRSFWCPEKINTSHRAAMTHQGPEASNGAPIDANLAAVPHRQLPESEGLVSSSGAEGSAYGAASPSGGAAGRRDRSYYFEPVSDAIKADVGVSIRDLRKVFPTEGDAEDFVAVKGVNLDLYNGQILALLGHNGAGKTTTINMMTGMISPTSGDALIYGTSIKENMAAVRNILGVVPQHDILFDLLTVKEHLELFAAIKGVPKPETDAAIDDMIAQVGLTEKVNDKSAALSGGMKRKLSVGIALLGDSKIVFLDEPTSGMDPYSRRATWDLLKKKKEGRVIILTTHFMDEADQLGDRIAIMAKGDVKCCGSSLFLKGRYGVGYTLTITKGEGFDESAVRSLLDASIPGVTPLSNIAAEISFRLPFQSSPHFADVFDQFDGQQARLGITGYGISVTTLEEVFLRVGHEDDADPDAVQEKRRMIKDTQDQVSRSSQDPLGTPIDAADAPVRSPELVVIGEEGTEQKTDAHFNPKPTSARGINTISVRPSSASRQQERQHNGDAHGSNGEPTKVKSLGDRRSSSRFSSLRIPGADEPMFFRHFRALFIKRWLNAKRDRKVWTWTLAYPFLILFIGIALIKLTRKSTFPDMIIGAEELDADVLPMPVPWAPLTATLSDYDMFSTAASDPAFVFSKVPDTTLAPGSNATLFNQNLLDGVFPAPLQAASRYNAFQSDVRNGAAPNTIIDNFIVYFNTSAQYATSLGLNLYNNQLLSSLGSTGVRILSRMHPLPQTLNMETLMNSMTAVIVAIGFAFMPANFVAYAVKEEQDKVKHQQLISGVSAASYWAANYLWDFLNYMVMGLLCLLIFRIWSIDELIGENTGAVLLAIILYGLSVIPFNYMFSFFFTESTAAQNSMLLFYIFAGALLLIAMLVLSIISSTKDIAYHLKFVCRLIPSFCFGEVISNIIIRGSSTAFGEAKGLMDMEIVGYPMIFMAWEIVAYWCIVLVWEKIRATPSLSALVFGNPEVKAANVADEDADVIAEKQRLQSGDAKDDAVKVMGLRKVYKGRLGGGNKIAVQDLWMGIPKGQCLGFLGINGAGKTTTLKMLTGDIIPGSGTATLNDLDILTHQNDVRRLLGYCPQFDALIDTLTAREHLALFARIKGVPEDIIPDYCEHLILRLGLQEGIADKPTKGYSGGNKRKLCVGIALIGNPPIVFLDEPSTGMDPGSRRFMWDLIASTMKNRSVILTTHSMEECEALCHRTGIMVGGRLRCLGSTTRLKNVYGNGYQLDVNVSAGPVQDAFKAELASHWAEVQVIEQHGDALKFRLPRQSGDGRRTTIGQVFRLMENIKEKYYIRDYSVSETTLEQIFIHFARQQEEETGQVAGL